MKNIPLHSVRRISDLKDMLAGSVAEFGDAAAFLRKQDPSAAYEPVSYRRFQSDVNAFGTALLDLGLQGQRIAVIGENQYAWVTTYLAVVNGVGIIVPIDRELPEEEIIRCLSRAKVRTVVFAESKREVMRSSSTGSTWGYPRMRMASRRLPACSQPATTWWGADAGTTWTQRWILPR
jgi:long-chain acyl-CoA synthetase